MQLNPESVKAYIAKAGYTENNEDKVIGDLARFYKSNRIEWYRPLSSRVEVLDRTSEKEDQRTPDRTRLRYVKIEFCAVIVPCANFVMLQGANTIASFRS